MQLPIEDGLELIIQAYTKEQEEKLWQLYLTDKPNMDDEHYMDWEQYKAKAYKCAEENSKPVASKEEAEEKADKILEQFNKNGFYAEGR